MKRNIFNIHSKKKMEVNNKNKNQVSSESFIRGVYKNKLKVSKNMLKDLDKKVYDSVGLKRRFQLMTFIKRYRLQYTLFPAICLFLIMGSVWFVLDNRKSFEKIGKSPAKIEQIDMNASSLTDYGISDESVFEISFISEINPDKVLSDLKIEPSFEYIYEYSDKKLTIKPKNELPEGQIYKFTIPKDTILSSKEYTDEDLTWVFASEPKFTIIGNTPREGANSVGNTGIEILFNYYNLDKESISDKISVSPSFEYDQVISGNAIILVPKQGLIVGPEYEIKVKAGIKTTTGKEILDDYTFKFNVKTDYQIASKSKFDPVQTCFDNYSNNLPINNDKEFGYCYYYGATGFDKLTVNFYSANSEDLLNSFRSMGDKNYIPNKPRNDMSLSLTKEYPKQKDDWGLSIEDITLKSGLYLMEFQSTFGTTVFNHYEYISILDYNLSFSKYEDKLSAMIGNIRTGEFINGTEIEYLDSSFNTLCKSTSSSSNISEVNNCGEAKYALVKTNNQVILESLNSNWGYWMYNSYSDNYVNVIFDKQYYFYGDKINFWGYIRDINSEISIPDNIDKITVNIKNNSMEEWGMKNIANIELSFDKRYGTFSGEYQLSQNVGDYLGMEFYAGDQIIFHKDLQIRNKLYRNDYYVNMTLPNGEYYNSGENVDINIKMLNKNFQPVLNDIGQISISKYEMKYYTMSEDAKLNDLYPYSYPQIGNTETRTVNINNGTATVNIPTSCETLCNYSIQLKYGEYNYEYINFNVKNTNRYVWGETERYSYSPDEKVEVNLKALSLWDLNKLNEDTKLRLNLTRTWYVPYETQEYNYYTKRVEKVTRYEMRTENLGMKEVTIKSDNTSVVEYGYSGIGSYNLDIQYFENGIYKSLKHGVTWDYSDSKQVYSENGSWNNLSISTDEKVEKGKEMKIKLSANNKLKDNSLIWINISNSVETKNMLINFNDISNTISYLVPENAIGNIEISVFSIADIRPKENDYYGIFLSSKTTYVNYDEYKYNIEINPDKIDYKPGENAKFEIKVTDNNGNNVSCKTLVNIVDKSLISEWYWDDYNILENLYERSFYSGFSLNTLTFWGGFGAGGLEDDGMGSASQESNMRKDFKDVAYWSTWVDVSDGVGIVEIKMPDNITGWYVSGLAFNENNLGFVKKEINTKKDVYLNVPTIEYAHTGDNLVLPITTNNYLDSEVKLTLNLSASGACKTYGDSSYNLQLIKYSSLYKEFNIKFSGNGECKILAELKDGDKLVDGVEYKFPVIQKEITYQKITPFIVSNKSKITKEVDYSKNDFRSELTLNFSNYIFYNEVGSESTTKSIIKRLYSSSISGYGISQVIIDINSVSNNISPQGCIGYVEYDACSTEVTSYLYYALVNINNKEIEGQKVEVPQDLLDLMENYLVSIIFDSNLDTKTKLISMWALSNNDNDYVVALMSGDKFNKNYSEFSNSELLYLGLIYKNLNNTAKLKKVVSELLNRASTEDEIIYLTDNAKLETSTNESDTFVNSVFAYLLVDNKKWENEFLKVVNYLSRMEIQDVEIEKTIFIEKTYSYLNDISDVEIKLVVNDKDIGKYNLGKSNTISIDNSNLNDGINKIEIYSSSKKNILGTISYSVQNKGEKEISDINITREFYNLSNNNKELKDGDTINKGDAVLVRTIISSNKNKNLSLNTLSPMGYTTQKYNWGLLTYKENNNYYSLVKDRGYNFAYATYIQTDMVKWDCDITSRDNMVIDQIFVNVYSTQTTVGDSYLVWDTDTNVGNTLKGVQLNVNNY